ncbi:hypothetical protein ACQKTA_07295 [Enterococcus sp. 22-H-5-01]|uniref:hypothetical protein n=1 Tax=Enterococcus sp. 22-H-5-01 TaxID=3418555 RepID=UPI003CFF57A9
MKQRSKVTAIYNGCTSNNESNKKLNVTFATIIGYFLPGLPSILWFNQKKKGWSLIGLTVVGFLIFQIFGNIVIGVFGAVDAYQLSNRMNKGERLDEWAFFWNRRKSS